MAYGHQTYKDLEFLYSDEDFGFISKGHKDEIN